MSQISTRKVSRWKRLLGQTPKLLHSIAGKVAGNAGQIPAGDDREDILQRC